MEEDSSIGEVVKSAVNSKLPIRRRYDEAFVNEGDLEVEDHIVPEATNFCHDGTDNHSGNCPAIDLLEGIEEVEGNKTGPASITKPKNLSCQVPYCQQTFTSAKDYQNHYNSRHMHACSICKKSLPSSHILELHVLEIHDTLFSLLAEKKPMYQCFLETCDEKFLQPEVRKEHCISVHNFPQQFHYWDCGPPSNHSGKGKGNPRKNSSQGKAAVHQGKGVKKLSASSAETVPQQNTKQQLPDLVPVSESLPSCSTMTTPSEINTSGLGNPNKDKGKTSQNSKSSAVPKHFAFGHAPHRAFRKTYAFAVDTPSSNNRSNASGEMKDDGVIDMKDVEEALMTPSK